ncbi:MAG: amino acid ABC transporter permease [Rhodospirillaceae bacterium]|jgi:general L-amino acid transport system permease protein|nr:amino acid ABC transporter permease [Rhodospirillaceae bacterium]|tara:strand:+ start:4482 stop:5621 length:1140 start_codon:yes stop_codon:yes gene_type:complete
MTPSKTESLPIATGDGGYLPGTHPDLPPPSSVYGPVHWIRVNLFGSITNAVLTLLAVYFLYSVIPLLGEWMFIDAAYEGESRKDCRAVAQGACWAFIGNRLPLFIYGFYPEAERWRVDLSFVLLILALVPILYEGTPQRGKAIIYSCLYPLIAAFFLVGGIGLERVPTDQFGGLMLNVIIGVTGIAFSLPIGIVLALGRQSHLPIVRILCISFIEFIRGVPLITLFFVAAVMLSYFVPPGTNFDLLVRILIMGTLFASGYMAEVIRGGLQAIPNGQYEAADAMGLTYWQSMRKVVLPQALKISIPGIVNTFIGLYKDTTLVIVIGRLDILGIGNSSLADTKWQGLSTEVYVFVAIFFFLSCFSMSRYSLWLEKKLHTGH